MKMQKYVARIVPEPQKITKYDRQNRDWVATSGRKIRKRNTYEGFNKERHVCHVKGSLE